MLFGVQQGGFMPDAHEIDPVHLFAREVIPTLSSLQAISQACWRLPGPTHVMASCAGRQGQVCLPCRGSPYQVYVARAPFLCPHSRLQPEMVFIDLFVQPHIGQGILRAGTKRLVTA